MTEHKQEALEPQKDAMEALGQDVQAEDEHEMHLRAHLREEQRQVKEQLLHRYLWQRPVPVAYNQHTAFILTMHQFDLVFKGVPALRALGEGNFYAALIQGQIRYKGKIEELERNEHGQVTTLDGWFCMIPPMVPMHARAHIEYPAQTDNRLKLWGTDLKFEPASYVSERKKGGFYGQHLLQSPVPIEGIDLVAGEEAITSVEDAMDSEPADLRALLDAREDQLNTEAL